MIDDATSEGNEDEHGNTAEHLAHYAHRMHTIGEVFELGHELMENAETIVHAAILLSRVSDAQRIVRTQEQMAVDLQRMIKKVKELKRLIRNGHRRSVALRRQVPVLEEQVAAARRILESEKRAAVAAEQYLTETREIAALARKVKLQVRIAEKARPIASALEGRAVRALQAFEEVLRSSGVGARLANVAGKILRNKAFGTCLKVVMVVGVAMDIVDGYVDAPENTQAGKLANAGAAGLVSAAFATNPALAVADLVLPKRYSPLPLERGSTTAIVSLAESVITGDVGAIEEFHRRAMAGDYGGAINTASWAGEYWANRGVGRTLSDFAEEATVSDIAGWIASWF